MKIRGYCTKCGKIKWFVRKRSYKPVSIGQVITTPEELCGKCAGIIKKVINTMQ